MVNEKATAVFLRALVASTLAMTAQAASASPAGDIVKALKDAKVTSVDEPLEVWLLADNVIVVFPADAAGSEDALRKRAADIARAAVSAAVPPMRQMTVAFSDKANPARLRVFVLPGDVLKSLSQSNADDSKLLAAVRMSEGERSPLQQTRVVEKLSMAASGSPTAGGLSEFSGERNKLATKLQALQGKGIGIKPYSDELARIDGLYGKAETDRAWGALNRLASLVREQEYKMQKPVSGAAISSARAQEANNVMAQFQGSNDAYYEQVKAAILARELGSDAPVDGPFQQERFRIAKRIQQLEGQGMRVDSYRGSYKQLEVIAATKDIRRISELKDRIRYLEQQLGLPPLQGASR